MIDWRNLRLTQIGLAVEGSDDKLLVEAFLDAGEQQGLWQNWTSKLRVEVANEPSGSRGVFRELSESPDPKKPVIWGLIDRDWRTPSEISALERQYPRLLILPRRMIENYCLDPDEFLPMLPKVQRDKLNETELRADIEKSLADWLKHGALAAILYENGADDFCRGTSGYPRGLLSAPKTNESEILAALQNWHRQLDPDPLLNNYRRRVQEYQLRTTGDHYRECVDGKEFFNQIIVQQILNRRLKQQNRDAWIEILKRGCTSYPADFAPLMSRLL